MTDPKRMNSTATDGDSVDWAERLRASMNAETADTDAAPATAKPADEEDDLAALLRAQLARAAADPTLYMPDTSEFEDADLDEEEADEDFEADLDEDEDDEYLEDAPLLVEPDFEDEEDLEADPADLDEEEADEDFEDEDFDVDLDAALVGLAAAKAFLAEEPIDRSDHDAPGVRRTPSAPLAPPERRRPSVSDRRMTDGAINGRSGASHAEQAMREENERLLAEEALRHAAAASAIYADDLPAQDTADTPDAPAAQTAAAEPQDTAADTAAASPAPRRSRPAVIGYDPLQVSHDTRTDRQAVDRPTAARRVSDILDTEMPVGASASPAKAAKAAKADGARDYTAAMPSDSAEDIRRRDAALWMELGYTADVRHAEDRRAAEESRSADRRAATDLSEADRLVTPAPDGREYSGRADTDRATERYRRDRIRRIVYLAVAASGALILLWYDTLPSVLSALFSDISAPASPAYPALELVILLLAVIPFATRLGGGVRGLCRFAPTRYSVTAVALTADVLYTALCTVAAALWGTSMPLFGVIPLFSLSVAAMSEVADADGEWRAFRAVSTGRAVYVLSDEDTPATAALSERTVGRPMERTPRPLTALRTSLVDGVFARMGQYNSYMGRLNYLLPVSLGVAILAGGISLVQGGDLVADGARVFTATLLSTLPVSYLLAMSFPIHRVNRRLDARGCAVIGTAVPEPYAGATKGTTRRVCFAERDILVAACRKEVTLRADADSQDAVPAVPAAHWRRLANRLFFLLGSPLAVDSPMEDDGSPDALSHMHVEIAETDTHYTRLYLIDDTPGACATVEVMMGSYDALTRRGIRLPRRSMEATYRKSPDSHVLYLAFDGHFRLAYASEYRVRRDFSATKDALARVHAVPVLVSYDPMLTPELLSAPRFSALVGVEMVTPTCVDIPRRTCSSGVVAIGDARDLVYPLVACRRMHTCYRRAYGFTWLSFGVVSALVLLTVLAGMDAGLTAVTVYLLHALPAAATVITVLATVNRESLLLLPHRKKSYPAKGTNPSKSSK